MAEIDGLLKYMEQQGSSDLHIKAGAPPAIRLNGRLLQLTQFAPLTAEQTEALAVGMMDERQKKLLGMHRELDLAYSPSPESRFRVNVFRQQGCIGMTLRRVATAEATIEELGLPPVIRKLAEEQRGLVLVTGTAGSGKTTSLAAMIRHINHSREGHIVTIEDPIEVVHKDALCIIDQREVGIDTDSYADALRHVVRQDPDVILIGEMRDNETVATALTAAEIGNLVLSTLHTIDAAETINRIIDFFPPHQHKQVRIMLASTLRGIVSLRLIPSIQGGLVPAVEVLVANGTIRDCITDEDKTHQIRDVMEEGAYYGMQTFDQSLLKLYSEGRITLEDAMAMSYNAHDFKIKVRHLGVAPDTAASSGIY